MTVQPSGAPIDAIRNCDFPFACAALTIATVSRSTNGDAMSNATSTIGGAVRSLIERLFESLERAQLKDIERSVAAASNEREVSQRVHRLEAGAAPLS